MRPRNFQKTCMTTCMKSKLETNSKIRQSNINKHRLQGIRYSRLFRILNKIPYKFYPQNTLYGHTYTLRLDYRDASLKPYA